MVDLDRLKRKGVLVYIGCRVDKDLKDWLLDFCTREGISLSKLLEALVTDFKKDQEKKPP